MSRTAALSAAALLATSVLAGCMTDGSLGPVPLEDWTCEGACPVASSAVQIEGSVHDEATGMLLSHAEVCPLIAADDGCATSDLEGRFDLRVSSGSIVGGAADDVVLVMVRAEGYANALHSFESMGVSSSVRWDLPMTPTSELQEQVRAARGSLSAGGGVIHIQAAGALRADLSMSSVEGALASGDAPTWYADEGGQLDPSQDAMSVSGVAMQLDVPAGVRQVTLRSASGDAGCLPMTGWMGERAGTAEVYVMPGFVSYVSVICP